MGSANEYLSKNKYWAVTVVTKKTLAVAITKKKGMSIYNATEFGNSYKL